MGRAIGGAVVGYFVMFVTVVIVFTAAYLTMGTERAFQPEKFEPSLLWIAVMFVFGFLAAVLGGWVCAAVGKKQAAITILIGIILVMGALSAIPSLTAPEPGDAVRSGDLNNFEAMGQARTPLWVALLNPVVGAIGTVVGGRIKGIDT